MLSSDSRPRHLLSKRCHCTRELSKQTPSTVNHLLCGQIIWLRLATSRLICQASSILLVRHSLVFEGGLNHIFAKFLQHFYEWLALKCGDERAARILLQEMVSIFNLKMVITSTLGVGRLAFRWHCVARVPETVLSFWGVSVNFAWILENKLLRNL